MRDSIKDLVPYNPGASISDLEKKIGKPIVKLSANESLWGPSPAVVDFFKDCGQYLLAYPDGGAVELKDALAQYWHLNKENFCVGNGTDEIIFMLGQTFLNPNDEVIIPTPTFSEYAASAKIAGAKITYVPQPYLSFNLKEIIKAVTERTKMVFLCNPNNPTGTFFTQQDILEFMLKVPASTLVILDEAYFHYANSPLFPTSGALLKQFPNLLVLRTFSKVYCLAALRIGYAAADPALITELEKVRQPFNANAIAQRAAFLALADEAYKDKVVRETIAERTWLTNQLLELDLNVLPSQANFILVQSEADAAGLAEKLLTEGLQVRPAGSFGLPDWLRISVAPHPYMEQLVAALRKSL